MRVLSIDCSTKCASCCVLEDETVLGEVSFNYKKSHSIILMPMIEYLLSNLDLSINSMDGFVISKGPGSFTGLRIGVATVKGLSQGTGKPFVGVSSLNSLAYNMAYCSGIVCPIIDALRNNVYCSIYKFEGEKLQMMKEDSIISINELIKFLSTQNQPICFVGNAVPLFKEQLLNELKNVVFAPPHLNFTNASSLGLLGMALLNKGVTDDLYTFSPEYLRIPQAEREYNKRMADRIE